MERQAGCHKARRGTCCRLPRSHLPRLPHLSHTQAVHRIEATGDKPTAFLDFATSSLQEMPPKLRVVFEENKVREDDG